MTIRINNKWTGAKPGQVQKGVKHMWNRIDLKMRAKAVLGKNYWRYVITSLILLLLTGGISVGTSAGAQGGAQLTSDAGSISEKLEAIDSLGELWTVSQIFRVMVTAFLIVSVISLAYSIFAGNVIKVGGCRFFTLNQTEKAGTGTLFSMFNSDRYSNIVVTMFLMNLYIMLWSLLLFIPGIIKAYEYRMVPYILAENPSMGRREAFAISKRMMMGKKWQTFVYDLSFIGWYMLSLFTFGMLNIFYVTPYKLAADAEIYTANRAIAFEEGYIH